MADAARWWDMRPAESKQLKTYTCPLCNGCLVSMNPNILLSPEGDRQRRRHAHTACVAAHRQSGKLVTRSEWERSLRPLKPAKPSWWRRLGMRGRS